MLKKCSQSSLVLLSRWLLLFLLSGSLHEPCRHMCSSLDDFEARKADEIHQSLRQRRQQQRSEAERRERRRAETRAAAKVFPLPRIASLQSMQGR